MLSTILQNTFNYNQSKLNDAHMANKVHFFYYFYKVCRDHLFLVLSFNKKLEEEILIQF